LAPELHITILSEKYHCAKIIPEAIIIMGINPIPRYASTLKKIRYNSVRIAKLKTILMVRPVSLFCQAGFEIDDIFS
jgi:hypothetical protein